MQTFENLVKKINFEYTQYFAGNVKHPPLIQEREINKFIRKYNMHQITNSTLRFRFNNLVARHLTFKEKWRRKMMEFEGHKKTLNHAGYSGVVEEKNIKIPSYMEELAKLPAQYSKEKIQSIIESKIIEFEKKGYKNVDVKIDIFEGKPKLRIKPRR